MCGIIGQVLSRNARNTHFGEALEIQSHRGPDGYGAITRFHHSWRIDFGHCRLAIIGIGKSGNQPMLNSETGSAIVFNGEIYNYIEIKKELCKNGITINGTSDTEVLLKSLDYFGIKETLKKCNGMWAFAYYNKTNKKIVLSRDRCGEKPLYLIKDNKTIQFASELKSLLHISQQKYHLNRKVISIFLKYGLLDTNNETFFQEIVQVPAGCYIEFDLSGETLSEKTKQYWNFNAHNNIITSKSDFQKRVFNEVIQSVHLRLRSEVPMGILLSGGLDSSVIAAAIKQLGRKDITAFTFTSSDIYNDESKFAECVAKHLKIKHVKTSLDTQENTILQKLELATWHMDAPCTGFSNLAHMDIMENARKLGVKVLLSGQGGDELFCGYQKYFAFSIHEQLKSRLFFQAIKNCICFLGNSGFANNFKIREAKRYLKTISSGYDYLEENISNEHSPYLGMLPSEKVVERQLRDLKILSVPSLCHYEDRTSMAYGREIRLPFLDPNLIQLMLSCDTQEKIKNGWTKYALRKAFQHTLPSQIIWRKDKKGFNNPGERWLKGKTGQEMWTKYFIRNEGLNDLKILKKLRFTKLFCDFKAQKTNAGYISEQEIFLPLAFGAWVLQNKKWIRN